MRWLLAGCWRRARLRRARRPRARPSPSCWCGIRLWKFHNSSPHENPFPGVKTMRQGGGAGGRAGGADVRGARLRLADSQPRSVNSGRCLWRKPLRRRRRRMPPPRGLSRSPLCERGVSARKRVFLTCRARRTLFFSSYLGSVRFTIQRRNCDYSHAPWCPREGRPAGPIPPRPEK